MIYSKKANFPYPLFNNNTDDYKDPEFDLDVNLKENADDYIFEITYSISSESVSRMLRDKQLKMILIIKSGDNKFYVISDINNPIVYVKKTRLSLDNKTSLQLMLQAKVDISFKNNNDINSFYDQYKEDIVVQAGMAIGFSNIVLFDGSQTKPFDLFEKRVDSSISSDIKIEISEETIVIVYKKEEMQFRDIASGRDLNNPYIYAGLQKAIIRFIRNNHEGNDDEGVILSNLTEDLNPLDNKLYRLMIDKNIEEVSLANIDEVIYLISDKLLPRYENAVRGLCNEH